jgi:hypothetical protein
VRLGREGRQVVAGFDFSVGLASLYTMLVRFKLVFHDRSFEAALNTLLARQLLHRFSIVGVGQFVGQFTIPIGST